ncbi:integral membrane protein [Botrytis cinerea]
MSANFQSSSNGDINIGWKLEVGTTVTFLSAAIVVALRCFTRLKYSERGWDDYLMVFALLQALIATVIDFVAVHYGLGRHTSYVKYNEAVHQQYYNLLAQVFCVQALSFAKMAIVVSYLRVIHGTGIRIHQILLWTLGILVFIVNTMVIITFYTACTPIEKSWNPLIKGTCWTIDKNLDFFFSKEDWNFCHYTNRPNWRTAPPPSKSKPDTFSTVLGLTWSGMERNIAILLGSVPALNALVAPATRLMSQTLVSSSLKFRSARSQSYQLSDVPQSGKLTSNISERQKSEIESTRSTGTRNFNTSEERIFPM